MLTVRHTNGALSGKDVQIPADKERVLFGRQMDCDVQFPPEETAVARRHFALNRKPSGSWTIETFGEPFVAINGTPADNGEVVRDGAKIELGKIGGPALTLALTEEARTDNYLRTLAQEAAPSARQVATQASTLAKAARAIAAIAIVLAAGGGAFAAYNYISTSRTTARLDAAQKEFSSALAREANLRIGADVRTRLARSVFNVQIVDARGQADVGGGTAWAIGPNLLATNGHVAVARQMLRPGERMIVRAPGEKGAVYEVVEHRLHPGYMALEAFQRSDIRLRFGFRGLRVEALGGNGYDVALLRIKDVIPEDARLELATAEEINNLGPGTPLATAGYPVELLANNWALSKSATPELHIGMVTSVTDMFGLPAPQVHRQLVHFDLPSTGGASGSPVVGTSGRVVALLNSGNMYKVDAGRVPNAALVNFGQRADLVRDMLDGTAERKVADAREYWVEIAKNFVQGRPQDRYVREILDDVRKEYDLGKSVEPRMLAAIPITLNASKGKREPKTGTIKATGKRYDYDEYTKYLITKQMLAPGYDYSFIVLAEGGKTELSIQMDGAVVASHTDPYYPQITCRLLTPAQQNTGNPKEPRKPCAAGHHRREGMLISAPDDKNRDVELVVWNIKDSDDTLFTADINYTLRIYQWPRPAAQGAGLSR